MSPKTLTGEELVLDDGPARDAELFLVDGNNLAYRAYFALPEELVTSDGFPTNALLGFTNMLVRLWESQEPRAVFVGWDTLTFPTYRHDALAGYQAGRVFDKSLLEQLDMLPELVRALGFAAAKEDGYEADDFLGAAVRF